MILSLVVGSPVVAELGSPQSDVGRQFPYAVPEGPEYFAKEIVVLGRAEVAGLEPHPVGEVPIPATELEPVHGDIAVPSRECGVGTSISVYRG